MIKKFLIISFFFVFLGCKKDNKSINTGVDKPYDSPLEDTKLSFKVHKIDVIEKPRVTKYILELIIDPNQKIDSIGLEEILNLSYKNSSKETKKVPDIVDIKIYESEEHINSDMGQWIGWLSKSRDDIGPKISISLPSAEILDVVSRLNESERRKIWEDLVHSQDKAANESERKNFDLNAEKALMNKYRIDLKNKYKISENELSKISQESHSKNWPFPKDKS